MYILEHVLKAGVFSIKTDVNNLIIIADNIHNSSEVNEAEKNFLDKPKN